MSRILKRPMFRKGGSAMEGVMSLAAPRKQYNSGTDPYEDRFMKLVEKLREAGFTQQEAIEEARERLSEKKAYGGRIGYQNGTSFEDIIKDDEFGSEVYDLAKAAVGRDVQQERSDVLANLLIRGGLGLVSGEGAGKGTLGAIATAFKKPTEQALTEMAALKQDPAKMLTAKTLISQRGQERLAEIQNRNKLLDAQKKAKIIVGPQKEGETDAEYAERVNTEAKNIIMAPIDAAKKVDERFQIGRKDDKLKEYKDDFNLTGDAAELYYQFEKNAATVREKTNKPVRGFMKARPKGAGIQYDGRNKQPGIYYDPYNNNYIEVIGGVATVIPNPLTGVGPMSEIPDVGNKNIVEQTQPSLDDGLSDPMYG